MDDDNSCSGARRSWLSNPRLTLAERLDYHAKYRVGYRL